VLDLPRWRHQRTADLRSVSGLYIGALISCATVLMMICFTKDGLATRPFDFTAAVLITFSIAMYLAAGGVDVAVAARRLADWI
jgi:hypothetical protein